MPLNAVTHRTREAGFLFPALDTRARCLSSQRLAFFYESYDDILEGSGMLHNLSSASNYGLFAAFPFHMDVFIKLGLILIASIISSVLFHC